jgi:hypothetical protein
MNTYTIIGKGNYGPFHPMYDPRVTVTLLVDGVVTQVRTCENGREGHLWALEQGHLLADDHPFAKSERYQELLAIVRHRKD